MLLAYFALKTEQEGVSLNWLPPVTRSLLPQIIQYINRLLPLVRGTNLKQNMNICLNTRHISY